MATAMRGYGGQNVMLMRNESSSDTLVAMLASCSPVGLQVPRSAGGLEDAVVGCGQKRPYYPTFDGSVDEPVDEDGGDDCSHNVEKKRRLTFDQVRSLERNFELENKLEPERKMQLAKELGLQPRQVAVWFQNRRARWKTKQLERDYEVLTLDYNRLKADFDVILQEKENLKAEIQRLSGKTESKERQECESLEPTQSGSETTTHPSSLQPEVPMKTEHLSSRDYHARPSPTVDVLSSRKEKEQTTSSDSNSSEIMDAESPRTIDSNSNSLSTMPKEQSTNCTQFSPESFVDPSMLHVSDDFCGRALSNQVFNRGVVKLEDGSFHEDHSCNYFLTQLDEQGALPWWDWP